eukprot:Gb_22341 [translate_table: standard]
MQFDLAELVCEIPTNKGGGTSLAADLYAQADNRDSEALASDQDDIELLTNLGDYCLKRVELAFASEKHNQKYGIQPKKYMSKPLVHMQMLAAALMSEVVKAFNYGEEKIRNAANFSLANINVYIALGELFGLQSERVSQFPHQEPQEVLNLLERAMNEGYGAALGINSTNFDAIIGLGEFISHRQSIVSIQETMKGLKNIH